MSKRFRELDETLRDLWRQRDQLTQHEWFELYELTHRILSAQGFSEYASLPQDAPKDLIDGFFEDKVYLPTTSPDYQPNAIDHSGALGVFYRRYLISRIRQIQSQTRQFPPDGGDEPESGDALAQIPDPRGADQEPEDNFVEPSLEEWLGKHQLSLKQVVQAALDFLCARGDWRHLEEDRHWIRLYLSQHHCPDQDEAIPLATLAARNDIPSYDYRARKLGITWSKRGFESPEAFAQTLLGQWIAALNIPIQPECQTAICAAQSVLCHVALELQPASRPAEDELSLKIASQVALYQQEPSHETDS